MRNAVSRGARHTLLGLLAVLVFARPGAAQTIEQVTGAVGVAVVIEAQHLCAMMRGVEKQNSSTVTSALRGVFRDDVLTREEFLRLAHR